VCKLLSSRCLCICHLIITDKGIVQSGILTLIENSLKKESVKYKVFDGCKTSAPLPENYLYKCIVLRLMMSSLRSSVQHELV